MVPKRLLLQNAAMKCVDLLEHVEAEKEILDERALSEIAVGAQVEMDKRKGVVMETTEHKICIKMEGDDNDDDDDDEKEDDDSSSVLWIPREEMKSKIKLIQSE